MTLKQVAEAAGVSLATVSYCLNDSGSVGQQTRQRVKAIAEKLGYRPNLAAKAMRTGRTKALGFVVPDLTNPFFPQLTQSVMAAASAAGYDVFLTDTFGAKDAESRSIAALIRRGIDGLVWFPIDDAATPDIRLGRTPTVVIDRALDGLDSIVADCQAGGRLAAAALLEAGHRRIGMLSGPGDTQSARQRAAGARELIRGDAQLVWELEVAYSMDLDASVVETLARADVTAVIAGADVVAIGVMKELTRMGRRVPQDISVVGFDNIPWSELCSPGLTTIDMPVSDMGFEAVQAIVRRIGAPAEPRRRTVFDVSLMKRGSIAPPRTG
ncbi:MAG TPA: LacI family DNA-binding transcriptional regulator [Methylibium sp.]|uniref:LacI family DNA-binding transcriptional regulator n=1 Tax=Methylibium sp. TaxID=2067992 RepID=UPI002DB6AC69|nr:LacI family DNA-binding transcriptional regulator [Methylibium sp.]HEU4460281.1 LacI family DNA-binding transcriptional regulator [Methylibium sp.]